ncbi:MAG TPA: response regulator [Syntrophorhabdaceae bacterium]|nr:response regulator [Syntrophorhabdaceae bacterium]
MKREELQSESIKLQWNFYERAINNYSIIMRIMSSVEDDLLISYIPKVFVEESFFDVCKIMIDDNGVIRQGFYSIDDTLGDLDFTSISMLNSGASAPSLIDDVFGYGTLYVYPLKKDLSVIGYLVLGKRYYIDLEVRLLRELEIVCDIYNKSLLLNTNGRRHEVHSKEAFERVLEELPDAFLLIDKKNFICYANRKAKAEFETKKGMLIGEKIEQIVPGITEEFTKKTGVHYGQVTYKYGEAYKIFKIESFTVKETDHKGEWRGLMLKDVVGKRISEEEYLVKQKMESIGMLAGGIAHDFNNMLTGILGYASLMKKFLQDNSKLNRYAEAIEHSAQRASKLTQHLLNFSRRQKKSTGTVNLNALLEDVLFLLKESFREITIEKALEETLPSVKGDEAELQNVFLNLLINAKDAMDGKGLLQVATMLKTHVDGKQFVTVEITDTGKGIDEDLKSKIFEPYFSTKENGFNLGMGLYLVDRVIKDHGGFIEIESKKEKGTKFILYMPVPTATVTREIVKQVSFKKEILKGKSILVVDDEEMIRELAKGVLADTGIRIFEAVSGDQAISIFKKHRDYIDVVFLDVIMPGLKGDEVLKRLREIRKNIKVIISSGFMSEDQRDKLKGFTIEAFLDKPFKDEDILASIIEVLSK